MTDPVSFRSLARRFLPSRLRRVWRGVARAGTDTAALQEFRQEAAKRLADLEAELDKLRLRVTDSEAALGQWVSILRRESEVAPPPPRHLQVRVAGKYAPGFFDSAAEACREIDLALEPSGRTLGEFRSILDFGCGSGRAIRVLRRMLPDAQLFGTDIDAEAIAWAREHLAKLAEFSVAPHHPPTRYADAQFDFVFAVSVFSHLPEDMQFEWLDELRRVTRPGGLLVLTTHGEDLYSKLGPEAVEVMRTKGFFYSDFGWNYGASVSLPDFYQTAYHSHDYIRREWSRIFDVLDIRALGIERTQDTVLLRRRA